MRRSIQLLDTSILDELLEVPGYSSGDGAIQREFDARQDAGTSFHLPVAAVIQTGGHIRLSKDGGLRRECAQRFSVLLERTLDGIAPWTFQPLSWDDNLLRQLIEPVHDVVLPLGESLAQDHLEMGDLLVLAEFEVIRNNLDQRVVDVDVWTLDATLRAVVEHIRSA